MSGLSWQQLKRTCRAPGCRNMRPAGKDYCAECWAVLKDIRCGECCACETERIGCGCDGAVDDGCFLCTPETHARPACPTRGATEDSQSATGKENKP